jgi:hypothetical protein
MRPSAYLCLVIATSIAAAQGCGSSPDGVAADDIAIPDAAAADANTLAVECSSGQSRACTCPGAGGGPPTPSTQECFNGFWLICDCQAASGDTASAGECRAGHYEGEFNGLYSSAYTFVGVPIPVFGLDAVGPGLGFTLNAQQGGGEIPTFTISDGYVRGTADGLFPFEGVLTGTLDCQTKTFTGTLTGGYCVGPCAGINEGKFSGPVQGTYDGSTFSFTAGTWELTEEGEPSPLGIDFGGSGAWDATWVGEGAVDVDSGVATGP